MPNILMIELLLIIIVMEVALNVLKKIDVLIVVKIIFYIKIIKIKKLNAIQYQMANMFYVYLQLLILN